jgi:hypothetical protein
MGRYVAFMRYGSYLAEKRRDRRGCRHGLSLSCVISTANILEAS